MNLVQCADARIAAALQPRLTGRKFAVVHCGGHQYKVTAGDVIAVQRLRAEIGSHIALKKVLLVGAAGFTAVGRPLLHGARVTAVVEEQKRMRNVVSLFATPGRRHMRWIDAPHAATILRIREVHYTPQVVAELDKYNGQIIPTAEFAPDKHTNPVYTADDGYDVFRKRDTTAVEEASAFLDLMT
ncbi:large subunit ribosomal protein L21 [Trypanosoma theileri]|uniref:Large ribosomal subunit protein bL21m n=1 Tax=Trypanosoma theileri TaxID=67003 RepID=A0A1X0NP52_9TRYP|nr:large subunit ribosomal protein L21 [Trypanosoma theileri]ORC86298.1 large subunit ribosomal protein L21 [Trypanosoma theileri]